MTALPDLQPTLRMAALWLCAPVRRSMRWSAMGAGVLLVLALALACTRVPFDLHRWLGHGAGICTNAPDVIVVLGGSGMPSGPELLRLHRAAELAHAYPTALLKVVHPDTAGAMRQMVSELLLRGVEQARIERITEGGNTREQALVLASREMRSGPAIALVTAPENMYRSVWTFRKAGFARVCGAPAWDHAMAHDFAYAHDRVGGKAWVPDVSGYTGLRYTFWNYLKLEVTCLRELLAIGYYRLNGWI